MQKRTNGSPKPFKENALHHRTCGQAHKVRKRVHVRNFLHIVYLCLSERILRLHFVYCSNRRLVSGGTTLTSSGTVRAVPETTLLFSTRRKPTSPFLLCADGYDHMLQNLKALTAKHSSPTPVKAPARFDPRSKDPESPEYADLVQFGCTSDVQSLHATLPIVHAELPNQWLRSDYHKQVAAGMAGITGNAWETGLRPKYTDGLCT